MACARMTEAVTWLMRQEGHDILVYLDDFAAVSDSKEAADRAYNCINSIMGRLALKLAAEKCIQPTNK